MTIAYPAIIYEENKEYWVEFPDLEGFSRNGRIRRMHSFGKAISSSLLFGAFLMAVS